MSKKQQEKAERGAIYARISLDKRNEEEGVDRQKDRCRERAASEGVQIFYEFTDNNVSAFSGEKRPEYDKMMQAIKEGRIDVVFVWALDRLTRRTKDMITLFELCQQYGVRIIATRGGKIDPEDASSRLVVLVLSMVAEQESIDRAARVKAAVEDRALKGRPKTGGRRMFGYKADAVTIVDEEAEAIHDAAEMIIAGKTLRETVRAIFDKRNITATTGNPMTPPTLRDILLNPRMRGISTFTPTDPDSGYRLAKNRKIVGKGTWPAIIDETMGEKIDAVLKDPSRRRNHVGNKPTKFLASVLTCSCGEPMYSRTRKNRDGSPRRFYSCKRAQAGGKHVSIGEEIDEFITRIILKRMSKPDALEAIQKALLPDRTEESAQISKLMEERNAFLVRREEVEEQMVMGEIDATAYARIENKVKEKIRVIDKKLEPLFALKESDPLAADLASVDNFSSWWKDATVEDQRRLTRLLMDISILPGRIGAKRFDPKRVQVTWKR